MKLKKQSKDCQKIPYTSAGEARQALREQNKRGAKIQRFYKCPKCRGLYHLTSKEHHG